MNQGLGWRWTTIAIVVVLAFLSLLPNFANVGENWWFSREKIRYGLDIQGGLHIVMGVDTRGVIQERLERLGSTLKADLEKEGVLVTKYGAEPADSRAILKMEFSGESAQTKLEAYLSKNYPNLQIVEGGAAAATLQFTELYVRELTQSTLEQAIETIRNRIDEFGVAEPSITAQGTDRVLVQLPGLKDAERAKDLINRTARLEFMLVNRDVGIDQVQQWIDEAEKAGNYNLKDMKYSAYVAKVNQDLKGKLPEKTKVLFEKAPNVTSMELGKIPMVVQTDTNLGGESLTDAFITMNDLNNLPEVALRFDPDGAKKFSDITGANINRLMAIVLDDVIYSAPNIQSRIPNGQATITLGQTGDYNAALAEAKLLTTALRAGALPAKLEQLEERTIGPSLGADSIAAGKNAGIWAFALVAIFMLVWYKGFGVVANVALAVNVFLILAVLTALEATLTLPGIAGIALTIGTSVDANVIIFERIKEELRRGVTMAAAIREGYNKAFWAILDANLMLALTSIILMYFGTGPIRGFAVTLVIGIVTSLFCAVFMTHVILDTLIGKMRLQKLPI